MLLEGDLLLKKKLLLLILIFAVLVFSGVSLAAEESYWEQHYERAKIKYRENPDSLANNYYRTISMANLGMIDDLIDTLDQFNDDFSRAEFEQMLNQEITRIEQEEDRLLLLNYHGFYHLIFDEYEKALTYFNQITELDASNIWPHNYKSLVLIELERYEEAHLNLRNSLNIEENQYTRLLLAINYYEQGNVFKALNELRKTGDLIKKFDL